MSLAQTSQITLKAPWDHLKPIHDALDKRTVIETLWGIDQRRMTGTVRVLALTTLAVDSQMAAIAAGVRQDLERLSQEHQSAQTLATLSTANTDATGQSHTHTLHDEDTSAGTGTTTQGISTPAPTSSSTSSNSTSHIRGPSATGPTPNRNLLSQFSSTMTLPAEEEERIYVEGITQMFRVCFGPETGATGSYLMRLLHTKPTAGTTTYHQHLKNITDRVAQYEWQHKINYRDRVYRQDDVMLNETVKTAFFNAVTEEHEIQIKNNNHWDGSNTLRSLARIVPSQHWSKFPTVDRERTRSTIKDTTPKSASITLPAVGSSLLKSGTGEVARETLTSSSTSSSTTELRQQIAQKSAGGSSDKQDYDIIALNFDRKLKDMQNQYEHRTKDIEHKHERERDRREHKKEMEDLRQTLIQMIEQQNRSSGRSYKRPRSSSPDRHSRNTQPPYRGHTAETNRRRGDYDDRDTRGPSSYGRRPERTAYSTNRRPLDNNRNTDAGVCYRWRDHGKCHFNDSCRFSHTGRSTSSHYPREACRNFMAGRCTYDGCRYSHAVTPNRTAPNRDQSSITKYVKEFQSGQASIAAALTELNDARKKQEESRRRSEENDALKRKVQEILASSIGNAMYNSTAQEQPNVALLQHHPREDPPPKKG